MAKNGRQQAKSAAASSAGVTIVELLVVILIISIVSTIAIMNFGTPQKSMQRQNVARELKVAFERARFDSVKRRAGDGGAPTSDTRARVIVDATGFTLVTDNNSNGDLVNDDGTFDTGDALTTSAGTEVVIAGNGITLPVTVFYNQRGEAIAVSASGSNPVFYVCNVSCSSPSGANANLVIVTPTGTVNLLAGNATPPAYSSANVTSVPTTSGINDKASLP